MSARGGLELEIELQHLYVHNRLGCMLVLSTLNEESNPLPDDDKENQVLHYAKPESATQPIPRPPQQNQTIAEQPRSVTSIHRDTRFSPADHQRFVPSLTLFNQTTENDALTATCMRPQYSDGPDRDARAATTGSESPWCRRGRGPGSTTSLRHHRFEKSGCKQIRMRSRPDRRACFTLDLTGFGAKTHACD